LEVVSASDKKFIQKNRNLDNEMMTSSTTCFFCKHNVYKHTETDIW